MCAQNRAGKTFRRLLPTVLQRQVVYTKTNTPEANVTVFLVAVSQTTNTRQCRFSSSNIKKKLLQATINSIHIPLETPKFNDLSLIHI